MDSQFRLTLWSEWRVGDRYLWLKGGLGIPSGRCISANESDGYVLFEQSNGDQVKTFAWQGRYISVQHYCLAAKEEFGTGRITDMARLARWIRSRRAKRKPGQCCGSCEFFDSGISMCFNDHNYVWGDAQIVASEHWCQWWSKFRRAW